MLAHDSLPLTAQVPYSSHCRPWQTALPRNILGAKWVQADAKQGPMTAQHGSVMTVLNDA